MKRVLHLMAATVPMLAATFALADIAGSAHDFSAADWSDKAICKPCHTPHNGDTTVTGRLWAHTMSSATSYTYHGASAKPADQITSLDATSSIGQADLDGATRLCLSCHDGTVALDSFMGSDRTSDGITMGGDSSHGSTTANLGTDLSNDHPVGYKAIVADYKSYYNPVTTIKAAGLKLAVTTTTYGTGAVDINGTSLTGAESSVSCVTCHDVHNASVPTEAGLLRKTNVGSALCLTCHRK